ncbi:hypothetical protein NDU88_004936 [Pleurodeles waltl]|uniref:Uncharacterized protein n=1 Tax=Pleurodeles waltl TaxID=8319 RepID=A0AAV7VK71_PLEWA|nr:hypothetical protein NDU88_004936 [Pleurodeles waltl]
MGLAYKRPWGYGPFRIGANLLTNLISAIYNAQLCTCSRVCAAAAASPQAEPAWRVESKQCLGTLHDDSDLTHWMLGFLQAQHYHVQPITFSENQHCQLSRQALTESITFPPM